MNHFFRAYAEENKKIFIYGVSAPLLVRGAARPTYTPGRGTQANNGGAGKNSAGRKRKAELVSICMMSVFAFSSVRPLAKTAVAPILLFLCQVP